MTIEEILETKLEDRYGNKIYHQGGKIVLFLSKNKETRTLGKIKVKNGKQCFVVKRGERHILYKINGWGFNYEFLSKLPHGTPVIVEREKSRLLYELNVEEILEQGQFLHFLSLGFEKQIFVPISKFRVSVK